MAYRSQDTNMSLATSSRVLTAPSTVRATHASLTQLLSSLLPLRPTDVPLLYHVPRSPTYSALATPVTRVVLSITPTPGFYAALNSGPPAVGFLHRPFLLDRRAVRRGTLVLASHVAFDEVLTVGYNEVLSRRLGVEGEGVCVKGYKGDPERRIGLLGAAQDTLDKLMERVRNEFGAAEVFAFGNPSIKAVAIMNAFDDSTVNKTIALTQERGLLETATDVGAEGSGLLYLTGQPREAGMNVAREAGVNVVCVGHRAAEEWGIRHLADVIRREFPDVSVEEVIEEEVMVVKKKGKPGDNEAAKGVDMQKSGKSI